MHAWHVRSSVAIYLSLVLCHLGLAQDVPRRPQMALACCETPPVVDGDLSDACWQAVAPLGAFQVFGGGGRTSDAQTVKVVRDDTWLYFAFEVRLPHPEAIAVTAADHDGPIAADDCVEVFLDPGTGGETYLHYMLSVGNVRGERRCTQQGTSKQTSWNIPWRSGTRRTANGWQAEMALPLSVVVEHGTLDGLAMNVCVSRILRTLGLMGVTTSTTKEAASWAPVRRTFHEPGHFGFVRGMGDLKPGTPLLVAAQNVRTGAYQTGEDGKFFYDVTGTVCSFTDRAGTLRLVVEDRPNAGEGETVSRDVSVPGAGEYPFAVRVPVQVLAGRTALVSIEVPGTGERLQSVPLRDMADLSLMRAYAARSYTTVEPVADVVCEVGLPAAELEGIEATVRNAAGAVLARKQNVRPRSRLAVPVKALSVGEHRVTVALQRRDGGEMVSQEVVLVKRPPRPGSEWKIDLDRGCLLNNDEPFFPFGVMAYRVTARDDHKIKDIASMGFNTIVRWGRNRPDEPIEDYLDAAWKHGLYVVEYPKQWNVPLPEGAAPPLPEPGTHWFDKLVLQWNWMVEHVYVPGVKRTMTRPNLIAWYLWDEPQTDPKRADLIGDLNRAVYEADGYHPTQVLYIPPVPDGDLFSRNCDILGIDPYWVPGSGRGETGDPNRVGRHSWLARRRANRDHKLAWVTPCAERWSGIGMRVINEREQRVQTYLALIHGAQGLLYFVYPFQTQATADTFTRLGREMKVLGPACTAEPVPQNVKYAPIPFDPLSNVFPDVQVSLKRHPDGGFILLVANWRAYPVDVRFVCSLLGKSEGVEPLFGGESRVVRDGSFSDELAAMDTRAYWLKGGSTAVAPVELSVHCTPRRGKADPLYTEIAVPTSGVPGRKNILRNSGFERCTVPGMPDYFCDYSIRTAPTREGYRQGDPRADCGWSVDAANAHEGSACLRLTGLRALLLFDAYPKVVSSTPFTFSAWVRGDGGPRQTIQFYGPGIDAKQRYELTTEWQRISQTLTLTPQAPGGLFGFSASNGSETNTVWIDAMQLERGTTLTEYEP